jgi:glycine oxidase
MAASDSADVVVVGGGVIGLAVAWRARRAGATVLLLERDRPGRGASHVAAGMLAPVAEAEFGDAGRRLLALGLRSARAWPEFAAELAQASGVDVGLRRTGTLLVGRDADEARELERQLEFRRSLGLVVNRLRGSEARVLEPALAPGVRLALEAPDDHSVDPRLVLSALAEACERAGVRVRERAAVAGLQVTDGRVRGLTLGDGERVSAGSVVAAAGAWSDSIAGLAPGERVPVRPVKGQILRLRDPRGPGLLGRVIRFEGGYVVPRSDGRYVLGATVEERGFELSPTVGGVYELLRDAHELIPDLAELHIEELSVGLRPGTPDNAPVIGHAAVAGLVWACGHYRNGILLAPLTAELVLGLLDRAPGSDADRDALLAACSPGRFGDARAEGPGAPAAGITVGASA